MNRPQIVVAVMIVGVGISIVAGCTAAPAPSHEWSDRMIALLRDPNGKGGAGGDLGAASGTESAPGSVELGSIPNGEYDVLAVCTGASIVHLAIRAPVSLGRVLASSDIACGATLRLPVTVAATGIVLEATNTGASAQWQAAMVTRGWEPTPTTYSQ